MQNKRRNTGTALIYLLLSFGGVLMLFPFVWMILIESIMKRLDLSGSSLERIRDGSRVDL